MLLQFNGKAIFYTYFLTSIVMMVTVMKIVNGKMETVVVVLLTGISVLLLLSQQSLPSPSHPEQ